MLVTEDIQLLANRIALRKTQGNPIFVWVTGMSGTGKSFVVGHLASILIQQGTVSVLYDRQFIVAEILADHEQSHHTWADGLRIFTDSVIFDVSSDKLLAAVEACDDDYVLVELGRGIDRRGIVNHGYGRFLPKVPDRLLHNSIFIYLICPFEERIQRNMQRSAPFTVKEGGQRLHSFAMENYHQQDDIQDWVEYLGPRLIIVDNS